MNRLFFFFTAAAFSLSCSPSKEELTEYLNGIIATHDQLHIGCEFYSLAQQETLYAIHADHLFTPASTTKLITSLAALHFLGPDYRFETSLLTDGSIDNTTLQGNLYLKGSGDPSLQKEDIIKLFKELTQQGITTITGNIYVDISEFDEQYFAPGTTTDDLGTNWMRPINALMVEKKPLALSTTSTQYFSQDLWAQFCDSRELLQEACAACAILHKGDYGFAAIPRSCVLLDTHYSAPLIDLVAHLLKRSDNLYADCIYKKLGSKLFGAPGSWKKGIQSIGTFIDELGIFNFPIIMRDGSGLSRYNLFSPHDIVSLLIWATAQDYQQEFMNSLAIAGTDGTLKNRMLSATSQVKAKTGNLSGVSTLSGYIQTVDDCIIFSIMTNGYHAFPTAGSVPKKDIEDAICEYIAAIVS